MTPPLCSPDGWYDLFVSYSTKDDRPASGQQRDLAASHQRMAQLAQQQGDAAGAEAGMRACWEVLDAMKRRGLHMDPQMAREHGQPAGIFGGGA